MVRILRGAVRVRKPVFETEQMDEKVRIHERAETEFMDDPHGQILSLARDHAELIAGLIQKNARHAHTLPQAQALVELFGRERYSFSVGRGDLAQANIAVKTRSWAAPPYGRNYPQDFLVLLRVPGRVALDLLVRELEASAQDHHVVFAEYAGCFLHISVGPVYQAGIAVINCQARRDSGRGNTTLGEDQA